MKKKVLFVFLGIIWRSPSAEAVFIHLIREKNVTGEYEVDSAGTSAWHKGDPADPRMKAHARKRGIELTSVSRPVVPETDFDHFDYIVAMDADNMRDLKEMAPGKEYWKKLFLMTDFSSHHHYHGVPDPYYSGSEGFELVLDLLKDATEGFYSFTQNHQK